MGRGLAVVPGRLPAQAVEGLVARRGREPGARVVGHAGAAASARRRWRRPRPPRPRPGRGRRRSGRGVATTLAHSRRWTSSITAITALRMGRTSRGPSACRRAPAGEVEGLVEVVDVDDEDPAEHLGRLRVGAVGERRPRRRSTRTVVAVGGVGERLAPHHAAPLRQLGVELGVVGHPSRCAPRRSARPARRARRERQQRVLHARQA